MQKIQSSLYRPGRATRVVSQAGALLIGLIVAACGGGGGVGVSASLVQSVASPSIMEGHTGSPVMEFQVTLNTTVESSGELTLTYSTTAVNKPTGFAQGGTACTSGVDYIAVTNARLTISSGSSTGKLLVTLCPDSDFEPNEVVRLSWSTQTGATGVAEGVILNDDAGGMNGTGSTSLLGGLAAFGRDTNSLTNNSTDGRLGFSFEKSTDCVRDLVTGLTWQKLPSVAPTFTHDQLANYVAVANAAAWCGHNDWRVPKAIELMNLMDVSVLTSLPSNADYLGTASDAMAGDYWASESRGSASATDAWYLDANSNGAIAFASKTQTKKVRLVRGGSAASESSTNTGRFTDHGDGTVSDAQTGLMWKKCAEGYGNNSCSSGNPLTFSTATGVVNRLSSANQSNDKGYSDWRVPTRNELASLVNRSLASPAVIGSVFPNNGLVAYISANTNANDPLTQVWSVDFVDGDVKISRLDGSRLFYLRLVRAGQ